MRWVTNLSQNGEHGLRKLAFTISTGPARRNHYARANSMLSHPENI